MDRKKILIILILLVFLVGIVVFTYGTVFHGGTNILVCAVDESEPRAGMGAIDMAMIYHLNNHSVTQVYPHGMYHPTAAEPQEAVAQGASSKLCLHDSLWWEDNRQGAEYAREIVEYNTGIDIGPVILIDSKGLDGIIQAASPLEFNGQVVNTTGIDLIREDQADGNSRGDAVLSFASSLMNSAHDPGKLMKMTQAFFLQMSQGNIKVYY